MRSASVAQLRLFTTSEPSAASVARAETPRRLSRLARATGFEVARRHAGRQAQKVLSFLRTHGAATDHQLSEQLGIALASINSTRGGLVKRGIVVAADVVPGPHGALRTRWRVR